MLYAKIFIVPAICCALVFAGCSDPVNPDNEDDSVIIEPGISDVPVNGDNTENVVVFEDKGEDTTVEDLAAAQEKISSYYFEQMMQSDYNSVFMQVWYCEGKMKVLTDTGASGKTEFYYDYDQELQISYTPGEDTAIAMYFDADGEDAPDNPLDDDYLSCTVLGSEELNGQLCYILQAVNGDKLWVSTKYGFPLQVEFVGHFGDIFTVAYSNVEINTVTEEQVTVPSDLQVIDLKSGSTK